MSISAVQSGLNVRMGFLVQSAMNRLADTSIKLATLQKINHASDDPAGLIAAELLALDLAAWDQVSASLDYDRSISHAADGVLAEVTSLVSDIESKVVAAASDTLTVEQREALQIEVDGAIDSINRLGQTQFAGGQLFGRTFQFLVGSSPDQVADFEMMAVDSAMGGSSGTLADLHSGGAANLVSGDREQASNILSDVRSQLLDSRISLGAFERYTLDSTSRVSQEIQVNDARALSQIRDADVALESSKLIRDMILAEVVVKTAKLAMRQTPSFLSSPFAP